MFRHKGKSRTYRHNLRLAVMLSFVAGVVNVSGVLSVKVLTTNVTGHFAFFAEDISNHNYHQALVYLVYVFVFLVGAFTSNLLVEFFSRKHESLSYSMPLLLEVVILVLIGSTQSSAIHGAFIAGGLLFSMGLQNALVTKVSQSVVRTTHLTGLFTDLGIELSQLFFHKDYIKRQKLYRSILLKLSIIGSFFLGCLIGGGLYQIISLQTLLVAAVVLILAMFYDNILLRFYHIKRRVLSK